MRPDWRRIFFGTSVIVLVYIALAVFGVDYRVIEYFASLGTEQAQRIGLSVTLLLMSLSGVLGFFLAKRRGRNTLSWLCACFLLNVWAVIYLWSLPDLTAPRSKEVGDYSTR
jgi:hypothetical protein